MDIAYVCRAYNRISNDDEGAVKHALCALGHKVICYNERYLSSALLPRILADAPALVLFNKWDDVKTLEELGNRGILRAFWYWDLVDYPDAALERRCAVRKAWMDKVLPQVDIGFCVDGDWVEKVNQEMPNKLVWLPQGADNRVCSKPPEYPTRQTTDLLLTGTDRPTGSKRHTFVQKLQSRYKRKLVHIREGVFGDALTAAYLQTRIVIAPDSPITDKYWSNRVYNVLGRGAYLLHPFSEGLNLEYGATIDFYSNWDDLCQRIDRLTTDDSWTYRSEKAYMGWRSTKLKYTYFHRCAELIRIVKERFPCPP